MPSQSRSFARWFMIITLTAISAVIIAAIGLNLFLQSLFENMTPPAVIVKTELLEQGVWERELTSQASLFNAQQTTIRSLVSAPLEKLHVQMGEQVKKGDLMIELDSRSAQAHLDAAQAALQYARYRFEQDTLLFKDGALAEVRWQESFYQLNQARSQVADAYDRLDDYQIRAPQDGIVGHINWLHKDTIMAGEPLLTLFDGATTRLKATLPASEHAVIKPGQKVVATLLSGQRVAATIDKVAPALSEPSQRFWVEAALETPLALPPATTVTLSLVVRNDEPVLIAPSSALDVNALGPIVWVVREDGAQWYADPIPCKILGSHQGRIAIAHPSLKPGMRLVTLGQFKLRPGQEIKEYV